MAVAALERPMMRTSSRSRVWIPNCRAGRRVRATLSPAQCVAGVTGFAVKCMQSELLARFPHVDDVVALDHGCGCGVAIDANPAPVT